ncbi:MAG TPA: response regulator transcription factor [Myxococcota bacterium]|jgi:DNA-binding response OmpR family regulator
MTAAAARPGPRILLVDDDTELTAMLGDYLAPAGFEIAARASIASGTEALRAAARSGAGFELAVLDLMLPDGDGLALCRALRADADAALAELGIVMLTARGDEADRIVGLEVGADDYIAKPFHPRELLARIRAVLRRRARGSPRRDVLRFGRLEIDRGGRVARVEGEERALTAMQFDLLVALAEGAGRVLTRDAITQKLRGHDLEAFARGVDVHVARLRAALEDDPKQPRRILTVRGVGYVFASRQDDDTGSAR